MSEIKVTSPLTKHQLLIPRVLCIGTKEGEPNFPGSRFMTGDIIEQNGRDYWSIKADAWLNKTTVEKHPHLFKPLPWWYGRTVEELPEYVKNGRHFLKVDKWRCDADYLEGRPYCNCFGYSPIIDSKYLEPADESEYQEYQKQKQ